MFLSSGKKLRVKPHAYSDTWVSPGFTFISDVSFAGGRLSFWMAAAQMQTMHSFQCVSTTPSYLASIRPGARFSKNLTTNLWKSQTHEKLRMSMWFSKNLMKNLGRRYAKLMMKLTTTLQVTYKNVKFAASDAIRETLCQRWSLVEYFELIITDNQSDDFLKMLSKNNLFS